MYHQTRLRAEAPPYTPPLPPTHTRTPSPPQALPTPCKQLPPPSPLHPLPPPHTHLQALDDAGVDPGQRLDLVKVTLRLTGRLNRRGERGVVPQHNQAPAGAAIATNNLQEKGCRKGEGGG